MLEMMEIVHGELPEAVLDSCQWALVVPVQWLPEAAVLSMVPRPEQQPRTPAWGAREDCQFLDSSPDLLNQTLQGETASPRCVKVAR